MVNEASVLQKLKNKAKKTRFSYQLILQLFCQEEFLRRLAHSRYKENLILKGGLFLFLYTEFQGRPTMDIDFLMKNRSNENENMLEMVKEIINSKTNNDFIKYEIKSIENITEHKEYHGLRIKMLGIIANTKTRFDIDFGVGDVIIPNPEIRKLVTQIPSFEAPEVCTYSLESTIAEKWDAIISRMETTSRMKDYYDIYYLASHYDFEGKKIKEAIYETLKNRHTKYDENTIQRISMMHEEQEMAKRWLAFCKTTLEIELEFTEVIELVVKFIKIPFETILNNNECNRFWIAQDKQYAETK